MPQESVTVCLAVPDEVRVRAAWVVEAVFAALDVRWRLVDGAHDGGHARADVGYGVTGTRLTLTHDAACWQCTTDEPDVQRDPLAHAFWWLARVEELHAPATAFDERGRFRFAASALSRREQPALAAPVDELVELVRTALDLAQPAYPGGASWALALTHDIDRPRLWTRAGMRRTARAGLRDLTRGRLLRGSRQLGAAAAARLRPGRPDPLANAAALVGEQAARYGATSTSYILLGHHHPADGDRDALATGSPVFARAVLDAGGDVGLHGSYTTSDHPERLGAEAGPLADITGRHPRHHRFHYLRHAPTRDWPVLDAARFATDASLGYAEHPGLRAGFSWPYRAWDHAASRPLDLLVVPLALMDATLEPRHLDVPVGDAFDAVVHPLLAQQRRTAAATSLLWHNDKAATPLAGAWDTLYHRILTWARAHDCWLTDVDALEREWRRRLGADTG